MFVCIFNIMPIVFTALVAFTDYDSEFSIFAAGSLFVAVPIVALYIALSKYLIQGGAAGAVKE